jgi:hypothetical protein
MKPYREKSPLIRLRIAGIKLMKKTAQTAQILKHLKRHGSINPLTALRLYGSFRLAARIRELRNQGNQIKTNKEVQNGKSFARYELI